MNWPRVSISEAGNRIADAFERLSVIVGVSLCIVALAMMAVSCIA